MEGTWEGTKSMAKSSWKSANATVNPNPQIDLDAYKLSNPNQEKLARLVTPVDQHVMRFSRYMVDLDVYPSEEWIQLLLKRFPWLNGVIVADNEGKVLDRRPSTPVKPFSHPLWFEAVWRDTLVKSVLDKTPLGPELYFGVPYYQNNTFTGLVVAHFDPRTLFTFCPEPEELIIIAPARGVWTPKAGVDTDALLKLPWDKLLEDSVYGQVEVGGKFYTWIGRYVGRDLFAYATESVDPKHSEGLFSVFK